MKGLSRRVVLKRAVYWARTFADHTPAHITTGQTGRGVGTRYFLVCGGSVVGGFTADYVRMQMIQAHVCIGCARKAEVTS